MSPPKFEVKQIGTHAVIAGHDARLTQVALTRSCTNRQTGDVCDFVFAFDTWLTQDQIAGLDEQKAFQAAYVKKLGLDDPSAVVQTQMRQFLMPYADSLKQLLGKAGALKGYPLKTSVRIAFGGEHCASAKSHASSGGEGNAAGDTDQATSEASALASKLVGSLFAKKKQPEAAPAKAGAASTAAPASPLPPGLIQAAEFSVETTAITSGALPAAQFDIPAGWKLIPPQPPKASKEFSCPKTGA
jgi:hypothetical protein